MKGSWNLLQHQVSFFGKRSEGTKKFSVLLSLFVGELLTEISGLIPFPVDSLGKVPGTKKKKHDRSKSPPCAPNITSSPVDENLILHIISSFVTTPNTSRLLNADTNSLHYSFLFYWNSSKSVPLISETHCKYLPANQFGLSDRYGGFLRRNFFRE